MDTPVAATQPVGRPRWMPRAEFVRLIGTNQADSVLRQELAELAPDTTDDIPFSTKIEARNDG